MKKVINVTDQDIKLGVRKSNKSCPIARAIRRTFKKGEKFVRVSPNGIGFGKVKSYSNLGCDCKYCLKYSHEVDTTLEIDKFISDFDAGREVHPFSFELEY